VTLPELVFSGFPDLCAFNFCNASSDVTAFFEQIFLYWIDNVGIDGWRCDTAQGVTISSYAYMQNCSESAPKIEQQFWTTIIQAVRYQRPGAYFLAEGTDTKLFGYGFDAIYGASLVNTWGGDQRILIEAARDGPEYYRRLQTELQRVMQPGQWLDRTTMLFTTNHDLWAYNGGSPASVYGNHSASMCAFLVCLFTSKTVSIYNGQEIGTTQYLNFNNADHAYDIDWTAGNAEVTGFYKAAMQIWRKHADVFSKGEFEWRTTRNGFALIRVRGNLRLGIFLGDDAPRHDDLPVTLYEVPNQPSCRVLASNEIGDLSPATVMLF
jgi:glycosidase